MWGIVLSCFAAVENYAGAIAIRFFLGVFESAVTPGFALFTSQWYTKKEQGARTGIWFSFNGWAQIFGGCLAYGIAVGCRKSGTTIEPWKIVFLATGLLTTSLGFLFLWIVPDNQMNCRWLSREERVLAIERIRGNGQGVGNKHFKMYQLREALLDPLSWAFFFYALIADVPNGVYIWTGVWRHVLIDCRWHFELLLTAHRQLWIHARGIASLWNSRRSCRSGLPDRMRVGGR
jgi:ACS family allantoate permease-like MFS transporter